MVEGPAGKDVPAWWIVVVAAPELESGVSDHWDGTIRIDCRIEVRSNDEPSIDPDELLRRILLTEKAGRATDSRALLRIGDATIPYRQLVILDGVPTRWEKCHGDQSLWCTKVSIVLDPLEVSERGRPPRANPVIAAALAGGRPLPPVEVQWTVHPSSSRGAPAEKASSIQLGALDQVPFELPEGRPAVTLRLPLYPSTAARGALPLTPATLLFADPAYDRDLAAPPVQDAFRLTLQPAGEPANTVPPGRGALLSVLAADRSRVNLRGVVTYMVDVRLERPLDDRMQAIAEHQGAIPGGDLMPGEGDATLVSALRLELQPRYGPSRLLRLDAPKKDKKTVEIPVRPGSVYELPLAALREADDATRSARLASGDVLVLTATLRSDIAQVKLWVPPDKAEPHGETDRPNRAIRTIDIAPAAGALPVAATLRLVLTDEPVLEPSPALYAALLRTRTGGGNAAADETARWRIAVPLHCQSPLPARAKLLDPGRDFRKGMMRRHAQFAWSLLRPRAEFAEHALYLIKADRNGQTYLPGEEQDFLRPDGVRAGGRHTPQ